MSRRPDAAAQSQNRNGQGASPPAPPLPTRTGSIPAAISSANPAALSGTSGIADIPPSAGSLSKPSTPATIAPQNDGTAKKRRVKRGPDGQPLKKKRPRPRPFETTTPESAAPAVETPTPKKRRPTPGNVPSAASAELAAGSTTSPVRDEGSVKRRKRKKVRHAESLASPGRSPSAATPQAPPRVPSGNRSARRLLDEPPPYVEKVRAFGAVSLSMIVHVVVIMVLALVMLPYAVVSEPPAIEAVQERPQEELQEMLDQRLTPSDSMTLFSAQSAIQVGHNSSIDGATDPTIDQELSESLEGPKQMPAPVLTLSAMAGSELSVDTSDDAPGEPHAIVNSYDEAMDRITQEILTMLHKSKVLVVWVFDQSESMKDDQQEIAARISKVYEELGLRGVTDSDVLLTAVTSYGAGFVNHTPKATSNVDTIRKAIDAVPLDPSGKEMMCDAVGATIQQFKSIAVAGRRQMAVILVTDESGDQETNVTKLEAAIYEAKSAKARIYVLGREAVFGYPYAHMFWRHPQTGHIHLLPIDRGPETPFAEQLQTNGFHRRTDAHPSGFGPYEQCRMARETGGIFFMLPTVEANLVREGENTAVEQYRRGQISKAEYIAQVGDYRRYTLEALRPYLPSLESRHDYAFDRSRNRLHSTVWKVISDLNPYDDEKAKIIELRTSSFSPNPGTFANQVKLEIAKAKVYVDYLHQAEQAMEKLAEDRRKEIYPRWQANYDLIYAQILAYKVRVYEYMAYLQHFMKEPKRVPLRKEDPKNIGYYSLAHWHLDHRQETITGDLTAEYIERSRKMFEQVKENHPGTPWAERAEIELARGFGVELMPHYHFHDPRPRPQPNRPAPPRIPVPKL